MEGEWNWLRIGSSDGRCIRSAVCFATVVLNCFSILVTDVLYILVASFLDSLAPYPAAWFVHCLAHLSMATQHCTWFRNFYSVGSTLPQCDGWCPLIPFQYSFFPGCEYLW